MSKKFEKETEKNQKLEKNMDVEIEKRVGDVLAQRMEMQRQIEEVQAQLAEKEAVIEKQKATAAKKKADYDKMAENLEQAKNDVKAANFGNRTLEKRLNSTKAQMDEKLEEIDKLYEETDMLKNTLENIRAKYDFNAIDRNKAALERHEVWSNKVMMLAQKMSTTFESYFNCGLCNSLAVEITVTEPCNHVFCK